MDDCVWTKIARVADGWAMQIFVCIMPLSVTIRTNTCDVNTRIDTEKRNTQNHGMNSVNNWTGMTKLELIINKVEFCSEC